MDNLAVSIIIITYNSVSVFACIDAVKRQIDERDEIIVIDDDSAPDYHLSLQTYCSNHGITLLRATEKRNRAHNRNLGARMARNPVLLFLDSDMLLLDTSVPAIKSAYATKDSVAFIGTRSAGRYDPLRLSIFAGVNIEDLLRGDAALDILSELPSIRDNRIQPMTYVENLPEQKYYWIYYYSCCCTVLRELFVQLRGFDETYSGWGVEDVDLGYRISLNGKISYLRGFCGLHIPHDRQTIYDEQYNCRNLKRLLKKAERYDVEFVSVYRLSAKHLEQIRGFLDRLRMFDLPLLQPDRKEDCLYVNCVSINALNGKLVYFDKNGESRTYTLIGIGTFFEDQSISDVVVSSGIVLYPPSVICGILQECIRVGRNVVLDGPLPNCRLDWREFPNLTLAQPQKRNEYRIHDMMELQFAKVPDKERYIVTSNYLDLETAKIIPERLPLMSDVAPEGPPHTYCVINLTRGTGYRLLTEQLSAAFHLRYVGIYSASKAPHVPGPLTEFPAHLYGLLSLRTPILLIVERMERFRLDFPQWKERDHAGDIVVDFEGNISAPKFLEN